MRDLRELDEHRNEQGELQRLGQRGGRNVGVFCFEYKGAFLRVIADAGKGWEHVSVSLVDRTPTWEEMDYVKRMFFKDHETAFQFHVPVKDHVNIHPYCLHLWRPVFKNIPLPQAWRV